MVEVLARRHPCQQAVGGHAAIDHRWRDRRRGHRFAGVACVLRADIAVHEEARRFHVQLLADVFTDLDQVGAALAALARFWFMVVFDARQLQWQRLARLRACLAGAWISSSSSIAAKLRQAAVTPLLDSLLPQFFAFYDRHPLPPKKLRETVWQRHSPIHRWLGCTLTIFGLERPVYWSGARLSNLNGVK